MTLDLNLNELGTLAQMVEERAKSELGSVLSRLESASIGELATLFSEGLAVANKWESLHVKVQAAATAPAEPPAAAPEPSEPAAPEAPADASEQPTVALPAVEAPAPAQEEPAQ